MRNITYNANRGILDASPSCHYLMSNKNSLLKNARNMLCARNRRLGYILSLSWTPKPRFLSPARSTAGARMLVLINRAALKHKGEGSE